MTNTSARSSNYDKVPATQLPGHDIWIGPKAWAYIAAAAEEAAENPIVVIDTYPGVRVDAILREVARAFPAARVIDVEQAAARPSEAIEELILSSLTGDRVFGVMNHLPLSAFYDPDSVRVLHDETLRRDQPVVLVGWGASLVWQDPNLLVLADLARWEIQQRQRNGAPNWLSDNGNEDNLRKYKRGFFVEWRVADRHKRTLFDRIDFLLDTNKSEADAKLITGETFREGLRVTAQQPFRVVPFFDPGVWGGQWMKRVCGLDDNAANYAWCFDCVPEENSLLLEIDGETVEIPALDLIFTHPRELLGQLTFTRFGAEFPIRFDFLDTMEGGNLSLQVHPLTDYIQNTFGMHYTQDESYYMLDAAPDAKVYLGLKSGINEAKMERDLRRANAGEISFPVTKYVNEFPARKHDHFLIPAGTVHCSGADSMVLEISATPFIFTFKMWDWDRLGMDGKPRPIHLDHALNNIQWDRTTEWTRANLVEQVAEIGSGDGWVEERTGLHELEFIETRRHWFTGPVEHNTDGTVNVLNLVEGSEASVESPIGAFAPFTVHYAETFIVPAQVGRYILKPTKRSQGSRLGTIKAWVRGTEVGAK